MTTRRRQALAYLVIFSLLVVPVQAAVSVRPGGFTGRVFQPEFVAPATGVTVAAYPVDAKQPLATSTTDTKGRYRLEGLPAGDYLLLLTGPEGAPLAAAPVTARAGAIAAISLALPAENGVVGSGAARRKDGGEESGGKKGLAAWFSSPAGSTLIVVASAIVVAVVADSTLTDDDPPRSVSQSSPR